MSAAAPAPVSWSARTRSPDALVAEISVTDAADAGRAEPEGRQIAQLVAAIGTAIHAGDLPAAQAQLAALEKQLPPRSLTLLRMQAWLAHEDGDTATALARYRQIVSRVPGDQTAVINLAILEAANGQPESARERLRRLRSLDPESRAVKNAIDVVEARLR